MVESNRKRSMDKGQIDEYFTKNWAFLVDKTADIFNNLKGQGDPSDLIQECYLDFLEKCSKLTEKNIESFFVRYISSQICWKNSAHNLSLNKQEQVYNKYCDFVYNERKDNDNIHTDQLIEIERWYNDGKSSIEIYRQSSKRNRILYDLWVSCDGSAKKLSTRLNISHTAAWQLATDMKNSIKAIRNKPFKADFVVAGCGPSIKNLLPGRYTTIGVNDAGRYVDLDFHVVVDPLHTFDEYRQAIIKNTKSKCLFTHLPLSKIDTLATKRKSILFENKRGYFGFENLISKSNHSPFVAAGLAMKMNASSITFAGVDLVDHPNFDGKKLKEAREHLELLCADCIARGIRLFNLGEDNILTGIQGVEDITAWKKYMFID